VQDSYVSISGFAADTSNFFAVNDATLVPQADGRKRFDVVIARPGATGLPAGVRVIEAPSMRGLILFRSLIPNDAALPELVRDYQSQQTCDPL
jgi:uncharacterized membrane protein